MFTAPFIKRVWALINVASVLAWLFSLGLGTVLSTLATNALGLDQPWRSFAFVGLVLMLASLTIPFAQYGFAKVGERLRPPQQPMTNREAAEADRAEKQARIREERRQEDRAAIHEVITTLESHKLDLDNYYRIRVPNYQGAWPENRGELAKHSEYDKAVRATERAFTAIQDGGEVLTKEECLDLIHVALMALHEALEDGE